MKLSGNSNQTLVNSLHRLLNCEIGEVDCVNTTEYITLNTCLIYTHVSPIL